MSPAELAGSDPDLHLLRRISFGPTKAELDRVRAIGRAAYVDEQLAARDQTVDGLANLLYPRIMLSEGTILLTSINGFLTAFHISDLQNAMMYKALLSKAQLKEVLADFWSDHFNTCILKNPLPNKIVFDRDVIRANATGNFRTMVHASVFSSEMLYYLDNASNAVGAINENYARELLELHTMGVDGGYSKQDMKALARILSGLGLRNNTVFYDSARHDPSAVTFLGRSFSGGGSEQQIHDALDLILDHPGTAQHIARKLCARFVSDSPPSALIDRVAASYTSSGGDIKAMMRTLLLSPEFSASFGLKRRRPLESMIAAMRACGINSTDRLFTYNPLYPGADVLYRGAQASGQLPFTWQHPDGFPDSAEYWGSTNTLLHLEQFFVQLVEGTQLSLLLSKPSVVLLGGLTVSAGLVQAKTPRAAVDNAIARVFFQSLPASAVEALVTLTAAGANPDAVMTNSTLQQRAKGMTFALFASPWFQVK